jgi:hypothetical protein
MASAKRLYALGDQLQKDIAATLGVSEATISGWLSRTLKEEKERKKEKAFGMWLACHTQDEIGEVVEMSREAVSDWIAVFGKTSEAEEIPNWHNFDPPIYNVWKQQNKSNEIDHFGNSEPRWLENLLYLYTGPGDIVLDPFAGSGTTIDICKKRGRRYYVSDRKPITEREHEIRQHDMVADSGGVQAPAVPRWQDVRLIYLDPPYWKQAENKYSTDPTDLANMDLGNFNQTLSQIIRILSKKIKKSTPSYIALIIQPTQWKAPEKQYTDHVADMLKVVKLPVNMRFSVPYESQQCNAQMVNWAKEQRRCLVLTREIIVWEV